MMVGFGRETWFEKVRSVLPDAGIRNAGAGLLKRGFLNEKADSQNFLSFVRCFESTTFFPRARCMMDVYFKKADPR